MGGVKKKMSGGVKKKMGGGVKKKKSGGINKKMGGGAKIKMGSSVKKTMGGGVTKKMDGGVEKKMSGGINKKMGGGAKVKMDSSVKKRMGGGVTKKMDDGVKKKKNLENNNMNLRQKMLSRLKSARLRFLNDEMYNRTEKKILVDKKTFKAYHESLEEQQQLWSTNPLDNVINDIKALYKKRLNKDQFQVADFGCGTARIAKELEETQATVHSFDLVALNEKVTVCDMSKTPLPASSVDVVVNCLSLMSSDCTKYIDEGRRVLKDDGLMIIVEVTSRIKEENNFISAMKDHGLALIKSSPISDGYFTYFKFVKRGKKKPKAADIILETCKYKRR